MTVGRLPRFACLALLALWSPVVSAQLDSRVALVSVLSRDGDPVMDLAVDDFIVEDGGRRAEPVNVTPAAYPVAVVVDTSSFARSEFQPLRDAVHQFIDSLSGRDVALYSAGVPAMMVVDFTRDLGRVQDAVEHLFAQPDGTARYYDAVTEAAGHVRERHESVSRIVLVTAGGPETSSTSPREVLHAVQASRSIVDIVDLRDISKVRMSVTDPRGRNAPMHVDRTGVGDERVLQALSEKTRGHYERIFSASAYATTLDRVRRQLLSEVVLEYAVPTGSSRQLKLGVRLPGAIVSGIGLNRR